MRLIVAALMAIVCGGTAGSGVASVYLTIALGQNVLTTNLMLHAETVTAGRWTSQPYLTGHLIVVGFVAVFMVLAMVTIFWDRLVRYGDRQFQSLADLNKAEMINPPGYGFVLGEQITPPAQHPHKPLKVKAPKYNLENVLPFRTRRLRYISSLYSTVSNVLMCAPTRSGKGVGFAIPNALTFPGSMVVLDVKDELWTETSRARKQMGDKVFRFAPFDFENPTHQYNPLSRLDGIDDMEELWTGLEAVAQLFLQSDGHQDWLEGSILLFVAAGILAVQRENATMGEIYRILFGTGQGGDLGKSSADLLHAAAKECQYAPAARELSSKAGLDPKIQQSYLSILSTAGLAQWANPKVERVTRRSDFDFREMRRTGTSVYLVVESDHIERLNSLIRLFFADLISFLRSSKPGDDEPWPIFMLLDEFDQLGHMPLVVQAMKQTAGHGGRFAIITQSIPGLLSIPYTPEEVKAIESACQVKLYIAASEDHTASEVETALGTRTGRTLSRTSEVRSVGFGAGTVTKGSEHRPLLAKQEIRDMDPEKIIILPERQNPILAKRIKYYESPAILKIHKAQANERYPFPDEDKDHKPVTMTEMRLAAKTAQLEAEKEAVVVDDAVTEKDRDASLGDGLRSRAKSRPKRGNKAKMSEQGKAVLSSLVNEAQELLPNAAGGSQAA